MKINVLSENASMGGMSLHVPLRKNLGELRERGINFEFFWNDPMNERLLECDGLFINSKVFRSWWADGRKDRMLERYASFRSQVRGVFYFDTTDSSGTLQTELLPYLTTYSKSFLLKNTRAYLDSFYGGRIYTDYYHKKFGVEDREALNQDLRRPIDESELKKLRVSWNSALIFGSGWRDRMADLFRRKYTPPGQARPIDITCRMTVNHQRETIRYQRERLAELLGGLGVGIGKLGKKEYLREMMAAKIGVSPFGWGEFAFRDFEIFKHGCVLMKPDVSHLETWPDLYRKGDTYVGFSWDFRDFRETVADMLSDAGRTREIAESGQNRYKWYMESREARHEFCDRVEELVHAR